MPSHLDLESFEQRVYSQEVVDGLVTCPLADITALIAEVRHLRGEAPTVAPGPPLQDIHFRSCQMLIDGTMFNTQVLDVGNFTVTCYYPGDNYDNIDRDGYTNHCSIWISRRTTGGRSQRIFCYEDSQRANADREEQVEQLALGICEILRAHGRPPTQAELEVMVDDYL